MSPKRARPLVVTLAAFLSVDALGQDPFADGPAWTRNGSQPDERLGNGVGTAGDVNGDGYSDLLVGSPRFDAGFVEDVGRVDLFLGGPSGLAEEPAWSFVGHEEEGELGYAVSAAGDVNGDGFGDFLVGARHVDDAKTDAGAVLVFHGSASGPGAVADRVLLGLAKDDAFGSAAAFAGDVNGDGFSDVIVGAPGPKDGPAGGHAYLFVGSPSGVDPAFVWRGTVPEAGALFGQAVQTAGDVDADGFADFLVAAPRFDAGAVDAGRVFVHRGGASPTEPASRTLDGPEASARFGRAVAPAGDMSGDGFADVAIGAPYHDGQGMVDSGRVTVHLGSPAGLSPSAAFTDVTKKAGARLGFALAPAGDLDGDGLADLLAGAPSLVDHGFVLAYAGALGGPKMPAKAAPWKVHGAQDEDDFGAAVATAGDVDGDGLSDVVLGARGHGDEHGRAELYLGRVGDPLSGQVVVGEYSSIGRDVAVIGDVDGDGDEELATSAYPGGPAVWVFHGGDEPISLPADWSVESSYLAAVDGAGDVDGDGYADFVIGRPEPSHDELPGSVEVYRGSPDGLEAEPAWTFEGAEPDEEFGNDVAGVGDVNADGYADVVVGAWQAGDDVGRAVLLLGSPGGLLPEPVWEVVGQQAGMRLGSAVAGAGDVNGDGFDDVLV
ncbi:MAG: integrin alpha, partial [Planctomycetota bacterium JB042]